MMRSTLLLGTTFLLTGAVIGNAYYQKSQFYPSVVYLTKSNPSMAVLYLQAFVFVLMMAKAMGKIFFGELRPAEMEHLIERSWYAVTETCLAFTVFRDDFSPRFVASFTLLLFLKCFHWLVEDRVDYMERSPVITLLFHMRVLSLLGLLGMLDIYFVNHAYHSTLVKGASVQLVFGFEYAILMTAVAMAFMKYVLHTVDMQNENPWENKAVYLLYTELFMGFFRVLLYFSFMALMIKVHTFPLFAIRPMYLSMRSFKKALHDVIMSRRAIHNMNTLYPDATPEELAATDNVCIICREDMETGCKKLPCNHIFHTTCLRSWFQRQQTCPTCRMDVLRMPRPAQPGPAPQAAAAAAQPVPPPQPPLNAFFQGFPYAWPPAPPAQPQQQPQPAAAAPGTTAASAAPTPAAATTTTAGTSANTAAAPPPPPPMAGTGAEHLLGAQYMPFMGYPGFPQPPTDPGSLSEEQLRLLEGQERANVEARLQWLRDIQTLLDGAMVLIQHYNAASSVARFQGINLLPQEQFQSGPSATGDGVSRARQAKPESASRPAGQQAEDVGQASGVASPQASGGSTEPIPAWQDPLQEEHEDEMHEIRRRRVQHFTSRNPSSSSSATSPGPRQDSD